MSNIIKLMPWFKEAAIWSETKPDIEAIRTKLAESGVDVTGDQMTNAKENGECIEIMTDVPADIIRKVVYPYMLVHTPTVVNTSRVNDYFL